MLRIFTLVKIQRLRPGLNLRTWVPGAPIQEWYLFNLIFFTLVIVEGLRARGTMKSLGTSERSGRLYNNINIPTDQNSQCNIQFVSTAISSQFTSFFVQHTYS